MLALGGMVTVLRVEGGPSEVNARAGARADRLARGLAGSDFHGFGGTCYPIANPAVASSIVSH